MHSLRRFLIPLVAALAFIAFAGDIVADSICDAMGHSPTSLSESHGSGENDACGHCICATHVGTLAAVVRVTVGSLALSTESDLLISDEKASKAIPPAIDHPPQLS